MIEEWLLTVDALERLRLYYYRAMYIYIYIYNIYI